MTRRAGVPCPRLCVEYEIGSAHKTGFLALAIVAIAGLCWFAFIRDGERSRPPKELKVSPKDGTDTPGTRGGNPLSTKDLM